MIFPMFSFPVSSHVLISNLHCHPPIALNQVISTLILFYSPPRLSRDGLRPSFGIIFRENKVKILLLFSALTMISTGQLQVSIVPFRHESGQPQGGLA